MLPKEEIFVPFVLPRERVPLVTRAHSSVILSSLRAIHADGHRAQYLQKLDPRHRDVLTSPTLAGWVSIADALAHYDACDALELDRAQIERIGAESGRFLNDTMLSVLAKLSTGVGLTPWSALANANTLGARTWTGGSFAVWKLGPKEARLEWIGQPAARIPYFRVAFGAFTRAICGAFARAFFVGELPANHRDTELVYRLSWV